MELFDALVSSAALVTGTEYWEAQVHEGRLCTTHRRRIKHLALPTRYRNVTASNASSTPAVLPTPPSITASYITLSDGLTVTFSSAQRRTVTVLLKLQLSTRHQI